MKMSPDLNSKPDRASWEKWKRSTITKAQNLKPKQAQGSKIFGPDPALNAKVRWLHFYSFSCTHFFASKTDDASSSVLWNENAYNGSHPCVSRILRSSDSSLIRWKKVSTYKKIFSELVWIDNHENWSILRKTEERRRKKERDSKVRMLLFLNFLQITKAMALVIPILYLQYLCCFVAPAHPMRITSIQSYSWYTDALNAGF